MRAPPGGRKNANHRFAYAMMTLTHGSVFLLWRVSIWKLRVCFFCDFGCCGRSCWLGENYNKNMQKTHCQNHGAKQTHKKHTANHKAQTKHTQTYKKHTKNTLPQKQTQTKHTATKHSEKKHKKKHTATTTHNSVQHVFVGGGGVV
jgi:hypothetical protein